jgi:hypothetical protein
MHRKNEPNPHFSQQGWKDEDLWVKQGWEGLVFVGDGIPGGFWMRFSMGDENFYDFSPGRRRPVLS